MTPFSTTTSHTSRHAIRIWWSRMVTNTPEIFPIILIDHFFKAWEHRLASIQCDIKKWVITQTETDCKYWDRSLNMERCVRTRPLYSRECPGTHCTSIKGWVSPRAGLDWCRKSPPTGVRSPVRTARIKSPYRLSFRGPGPPCSYKNSLYRVKWNKTIWKFRCS
jgi:hypothetical protein